MVDISSAFVLVPALLGAGAKPGGAAGPPPGFAPLGADGGPAGT